MTQFSVCSVVFGIPLSVLLWTQGASPELSVLAAGLGTFALHAMIRNHRALKNS